MLVWSAGLSVGTEWLEFFLWWHVVWNISEWLEFFLWWHVVWNISGGSFLTCVGLMLFHRSAFWACFEVLTNLLPVNLMWCLKCARQ